MPGALWLLPLFWLPTGMEAQPDRPASNAFLTAEAFTPFGAFVPCVGLRATRMFGPIGVEAGIGAPVVPVVGVLDLGLVVGSLPRDDADGRLLVRAGASRYFASGASDDRQLGWHVGLSYLTARPDGIDVRLDATLRAFTSGAGAIVTVGAGFVLPRRKGSRGH